MSGMTRQSLIAMLASACVISLAACQSGSDSTGPEPDPGTPPTITKALTTTHNLTVDGIRREFIVYAPGGVPSTQLLPVVFVFHGTSGDGQKFYSISGWKEKCEVEKCIAVFPSSLEWCFIDDGVPKRNTKWHTPELESIACAGQTLADDVKFVRQMVDFLKTSYRVETRRIYASGFSNGGAFSSLLWSSASDVFAAVAASAGFLAQATPVPAIRIPYFFTIGDTDDLFPALALPMPMGEPFLALPQMQLVVSFPLTKLQLSPTHTTTVTTNGTLFRYTTPSSANTEMNVMVVRGLFHQYANGINHQLVYADLFWDFFKRFSK